MPRLLDLPEFRSDYFLAADLTRICEQLETLLLGAQDTLIATRSDAMVAAEMVEFFKKTMAKPSDAAKKM